MDQWIDVASQQKGAEFNPWFGHCAFLCSVCSHISLGFLQVSPPTIQKHRLQAQASQAMTLI